MRTHRFHIFLLSLILMLVICAETVLAGVDPQQAAELEALLLARFNQARVAPLDTAAQLGKDPQALLAQLPELAGILQSGLAPLADEAHLKAAAQAHTEDMLANNYYSKVSLDGRTYVDRIAANHYPPLTVGETLAVVAFRNFIEPQKAVEILFQNIFLDELRPGTDAPRNLLDPRYEHAGIGIRTGTLTFGQAVYNVYVATCDFGSAYGPAPFTIESAEAALIHLINQARSNPMAAAAALGMDPQTLLAAWPQWAEVLQAGTLPVAPDALLGQAAREHTEEMVALRFFDQNSWNGVSVEQRLANLGYSAVLSEQVIDLLPLGAEVSLEGVSTAFYQSLMSRLLTSDQAEKALAIFDPAMAGIGICLRPVAPLEGEGFNHLYIMTVVFATPAEITPPRLLGVLYVDRNGNGLYDAAEGISWLPLTVTCTDSVQSIATDAAGGVDVMPAQGLIQFIVWPGVLDEAFWLDMSLSHQWFAHPVNAGDLLLFQSAADPSAADAGAGAL